MQLGHRFVPDAFAGLLAGLAALTARGLPVEQHPGRAGGGKSASLKIMEEVAIAAHRCWFASGDPAFRAYRMANELNSFSGRPRFLLVPAKNYQGGRCWSSRPRAPRAGSRRSGR